MAEEGKKVRFRTILEVLGKPKEHVEKAIKEYVEDIRSNPNYLIIKEEFSKPKEQEKMWSVFAELEMVVKDVQELFGFCFSYMPSSIEILKPDEVTFSNLDVTGVLNDLQAKLHGLDSTIKRFRAENGFLKRNFKTTITNFVSVVLSVKGQLTIDDLSKFSGVISEELDGLLKEMLKEGKIKKEEDFYCLP
ncbi:MAG: hypothetical protein KJ601_04820 [Nanoarchaeota archaeon]|nr:hypothetical protein [Nanoarchaeota archaeon]MBU1703745.1 hypothetical protein [Nanoarchaeota archaeon]